MSCNQNHPTPKPLCEAIAELERRLESPQVPGELPGWLAGAAESFQKVAPLVQQHLERTHARQFEEILNQDAELSHRVIQLKAEDAQILAELEVLDKAISEMQVQYDQADTDQTKPIYDAAAGLADRGLALVIAFRKQEAALATWFVEAFQRDRGTGD